MSFVISACFVSETSPNYVFKHTFGFDSWSNLNYWDDLGRFVSWVVSTGENYLMAINPDGNDYVLHDVNVISGDSDSEVVGGIF